MTTARRLCASVLAVVGVAMLAGPGWALLAAAGLLWLPLSLDPRLARVLGTVRALWAALGRMATVQRASLLLVAGAIVGVGVGLAVWIHPGAGLVAAAVASGALGLRLERTG